MHCEDDSIIALKILQLIWIPACWQASRQADRQADKQAGKQAGKHVERQADKQASAASERVNRFNQPASSFDGSVYARVEQGICDVYKAGLVIVGLETGTSRLGLEPVMANSQFHMISDLVEDKVYPIVGHVMDFFGFGWAAEISWFC